MGLQTVGVQSKGGGRDDGQWDYWKWASRIKEIEKMIAYRTIDNGHSK